MKKILNVLLLLVLTFCMIVPAFASDVRTGDVTGADAVYEDTKNAVNSMTNEMIDTTVTTEGLVDRLESKGNDIVKILQTVGKYVCIAAFVVCCILTLVGVIGNKKMLAGGIIGLVLSGVAYAGIVCGREIVNFIAAWAAS